MLVPYSVLIGEEDIVGVFPKLLHVYILLSPSPSCSCPSKSCGSQSPPCPHQIILLLSVSYTHMILFVDIKSRTHKWEEKQDISLCVIGFIQLIVLSPVASVFLKMTELWSPLWLKHLLSCIYHLFLTHFSLVGHLCWRHSAAVVNGVTINIDVQVSLLSVDLQSKT